jgi:hypothetical protein
MLQSARELTSYSIGAVDGDIGRVYDLYVDDQGWTIRYLVVDTGHWLAGRRVLLSPLSLLGIAPQRKILSASLTMAQVANSPDVDTEKPVSRQRELAFSRYYGLPSYWTGDVDQVPLVGAIAPGASDALRDAPEDDNGDPHLRSTRAITHYYVHALDADIGHVADLLLDAASWRIGHLVVATGAWWPARKVLLPVGWVDQVNWTTNSVDAALRGETIKRAPGYDISMAPSAEYLARLAAYYGAPPGTRGST